MIFKIVLQEAYAQITVASPARATLILPRRLGGPFIGGAVIDLAAGGSTLFKKPGFLRKTRFLAHLPNSPRQLLFRVTVFYW
jgi:hypothetical protein